MIKNGTEIQLKQNKYTVVGIASLEKVLEAILNVAILDEKDVEKKLQSPMHSMEIELEESTKNIKGMNNFHFGRSNMSEQD